MNLQKQTCEHSRKQAVSITLTHVIKVLVLAQLLTYSVSLLMLPIVRARLE